MLHPGLVIFMLFLLAVFAFVVVTLVPLAIALAVIYRRRPLAYVPLLTLIAVFVYGWCQP